MSKSETVFAMHVLDRALSVKRPHGTCWTTQHFRMWLQQNLPHASTIDRCGNIHVDLRSSPSCRTLFTSHLDTVHLTGGPNMILKTKFKWAAVGAPLGADDGAGIAIMSHMILNNVQGYYVFTQGEERGGLGARFIANTNKELLQQFDRAIAFDRCGNSSVITHQGWDGRSASDEFAIALSNSLNSFGMMYAPDDTGIYTDTAEFVRHIPECTNLSVGYNMEHSEFEVLDIRHFLAMCQAVVGLDWESLPTVRDYKNQYHTSQTFDSSLMDTNNMEWSD